MVGEVGRLEGGGVVGRGEAERFEIVRNGSGDTTRGLYTSPAPKHQT